MKLCGDVDFSSHEVAASLQGKLITPDGHKAYLCGHRDSDSQHQQFSYLTIIADVRLDNREDLRQTLDAELRHSAPDDTDLVLAAYVKWGEQCGGFLLGEFAFASLLLKKTLPTEMVNYQHSDPRRGLALALFVMVLTALCLGLVVRSLRRRGIKVQTTGL